MFTFCRQNVRERRKNQRKYCQVRSIVGMSSCTYKTPCPQHAHMEPVYMYIGPSDPHSHMGPVQSPYNYCFHLMSMEAGHVGHVGLPQKANLLCMFSIVTFFTNRSRCSCTVIISMFLSSNLPPTFSLSSGLPSPSLVLLVRLSYCFHLCL